MTCIKIKKILRFYYRADELERVFDNLIFKAAMSAYDKSCYAGADRLCRIIDEKRELAGLWAYLDGIISRLSEEERNSLEEYACLRCGIKRLCAEDIKRLRRAVVKFRRKARRLDRFIESIRLVAKYYCLMNA